MGYTHYWTFKKELSQKDFNIIKETITPVLKKYHYMLANGVGDRKTLPVIESDYIAFNGIEDKSHETFSIRVGENEFNFCKTALKSYDKIVVACLVLIKEILGNDKFEWSSDGDLSDHQKGIEIANKFINPTEKRIKELIHLIKCSPDDVKLLKKEYQELTGKRFYNKKGV